MGSDHRCDVYSGRRSTSFDESKIIKGPEHTNSSSRASGDHDYLGGHLSLKYVVCVCSAQANARRDQERSHSGASCTLTLTWRAYSLPHPRAPPRGQRACSTHLRIKVPSSASSRSVSVPVSISLIVRDTGKWPLICWPGRLQWALGGLGTLLVIFTFPETAESTSIAFTCSRRAPYRFRKDEPREQDAEHHQGRDSGAQDLPGLGPETRLGQWHFHQGASEDLHSSFGLFFLLAVLWSTPVFPIAIGFLVGSRESNFAVALVSLLYNFSTLRTCCTLSTA
ncbi:BQ5605_C025g10063 [Microbotryum silenes-dioicae]|uniref:BQ5605_C025g10063 protein n=1 Tax=Microbotryum silenes-dioicae TaxID=796604 RepID=A0A2X0MQL1_9BASI|nr:BQ5605_C025g10063 [Microbotryum silenes-dioicae]